MYVLGSYLARTTNIRSEPYHTAKLRSAGVNSAKGGPGVLEALPTRCLIIVRLVVRLAGYVYATGIFRASAGPLHYSKLDA